GGSRAPPALGCVRRPGGRCRRRGDGGARARERRAREVRRRLGGRDEAQPRRLPRGHPGGPPHGLRHGMTAPLAVFIGPMGAGKTRLCKPVERALEVPFTYTEKVSVADHGPIADIFNSHVVYLYPTLDHATSLYTVRIL